MNTPIPTPKMIGDLGGTIRFAGGPLTIQAHGSEAEFARDWLAACIEKDFQVTAHAGAEAGIHIGLLDDLIGGALADEAWRLSPAFEAPLGREQGYVLQSTEDSVVIAALSATGLLHGAATLLQLLRPEEGALVAPCCRIEDWPDFRFRAAADWLLNVEINRWGYERGDGRAAMVARMKRKIDLAARHKANVIWFDGFGWSTDRVPGYADFARELATYAAERHVRLAHAGYGGGYGFAYQKSQLYRAPYQGRTFENRVSYPDGEVYDCVGLSNHAVSRRYGTCLSNEALTELKLAELVEFVRECRPGMLYIHDIDSGSLGAAHQGWTDRCARCRERWPDDEMVSEQGAAAAYASWFRKVASAINAVKSEDGAYAAECDCEIAFVGPMYTGYGESDEIWAAACDYFTIMSQHMGPFPNVQFGIREQFASDDPPGTRVSTLKDRLDAVGHGHGVFVIAFVGGDNYYMDQLLSSGPALHNHYRSADTVYTKTLGSVVEPAQLVCAEYAWHSTAPGAYDVTCSRNDMLELLERCRTGMEVRDEIYGQGGLLSRACDRLYGSQAGPYLTQLLSLGLGTGVFPLLTGWGAVRREVAALLEASAEGASERCAHWEQREALTRDALSLATSALGEPLPSEDVRADLQWLRTGLEVALRTCRALAACWEWLREPTDESLATVSQSLDELQTFLDAHVPTDTTDPVGGDPAVWRATVAKLGELLGRE